MCVQPQTECQHKEQEADGNDSAEVEDSDHRKARQSSFVPMVALKMEMLHGSFGAGGNWKGCAWRMGFLVAGGRGWFGIES